MKTLVFLTFVALVFGDTSRSVEKPKDKRTPIGQSSLQSGSGGGSYSSPSSSYGTPSSQYGAPSSQYGSPSSQYGALSSQYGAPSLGYSVPNTAYYQAPSHSYGAPGLQGLTAGYLPSHGYSLSALNLAGGYGAHGAGAADLSGLLQQSYLLQPAVHNLFTPQFDFTNLYSGLGAHGYQQSIPVLSGASATASKLGPVTFGIGHGGIQDLGVYSAPQLAHSYQTPSQTSYSSGASSQSSYPSGSLSYIPSPSSSYSSGSSYSPAGQSYTYSAPSSSYSAPSSSYSSPSSSYSAPSSSYSSPSSSYSAPSSSYSSPSSSYSSPSSSYSSPSSSYGAPSSSAYNTISYSKP